MARCNLCGSESAALAGSGKRRFYLCGDCALVFVPPEYWLLVEDERARYDLHDNSLTNDGYVKFLSQVVDVVMSVVDGVIAGNCVKAGARTKVLDFGCGKEAVACRLLKDRGIDCYGYDPLYGRLLPESVSKSGQYDIIILCEVIEHLRDVRGELALIGGLLREGGIIILRTQLYESLSSFPSWWYAQDLTHINFFSERSLSVVAGMVGKRLEKTEFPDIFLLVSTGER
jgi:SAM-dependent methyltransferase